MPSRVSDSASAAVSRSSLDRKATPRRSGVPSTATYAASGPVTSRKLSADASRTSSSLSPSPSPSSSSAPDTCQIVGRAGERRTNGPGVVHTARVIKLDLLLGAAAFAVWIYCLIDVAQTPNDAIRNLNKGAWILIVLFFSVVGSIG